MNTTDLGIKQHQRAITILKTIERKERQFKDFTTRLQIEENKPYIMSFLTTPRQWYETEIAKCEEMISRLEIKYLEIISNLNIKIYGN